MMGMSVQPPWAPHQDPASRGHIPETCVFLEVIIKTWVFTFQGQRNRNLSKNTLKFGFLTVFKGKATQVKCLVPESVSLFLVSGISTVC